MLDPKVLRGDPGRVRSMLERRGVEFDLDSLLDADRRRLEYMEKADALRRERNLSGREFSRRKKSGQDTAPVTERMRGISDELTRAESELERAEAAYGTLMRTIPNLIDESVPTGADERSNREIRRWGGAPGFGFEPKDHVDISAARDLVDLQRAAKVSGARFYYLKGKLVRLNQALINYALDLMDKKGYTLIQPPYMINRGSMEGAVIAEDFEDVIYKIQDDDLYLIGTSEHAVAAMHSGEILDGKDLPIRYAAVSPCFRREAGAHGRDQKGIFRVHQFEKIEQFVFSRPEDSRAEHERMLSVSEEFYRSLGIPYRTVLLSSGDMGKVSAKTYDIEGWMAGQRAYREMVSCSNCLDFQSRRLMVRFRDRTNDQTRFVHTLNSTVVATSRAMVAILENFQTADSRIRLPAVLHDYVGSDTI